MRSASVRDAITLICTLPTRDEKIKKINKKTGRIGQPDKIREQFIPLASIHKPPGTKVS